MSTRAKVASALASIGVLTVGWQVGTANGHTLPATTSTSAESTSTSTATAASTTAAKKASSSTTSTSTTSSSTSTSSSSSSGLNDGTYTGKTSSDRYGNVTVSITITNGKITAVNATSDANDNHSAQINSRAIPVLKSATLSAQDGDISTVSGATYTSESYITSLQSALDQAAA